MIYQRERNKLKEVRNLKLLNKKHVAARFEEETVRDRAAALDDDELFWAIDELTKRGRIRGAVIL